MSSRRNLERWIRDWVLWFGGSWKQNALAKRIKTTIGGFGAVKPNAWDFNAWRRGWWVWKISTVTARKKSRIKRGKIVNLSACVDEITLRCELNSS